jgi:CrcB protein
MPKLVGAGFPFATLTVNVVGSFTLAAIMYLATAATALSPAARLILGTGFCGGFTTYSTFNYETMKMLQERAFTLAAVNAAATGIGCLVAGYLGWTGARLLLGK